MISYREPDIPLDVTTVYGKTTPVYDMGKARSVMNDTALYIVIVFLISYREPDIPLDLTTVYGKTTPVYDMGKARSVMNEFEKQMSAVKLEDTTDDWEEKLNR